MLFLIFFGGEQNKVFEDTKKKRNQKPLIDEHTRLFQCILICCIEFAKWSGSIRKPLFTMHFFLR